MKRNRYGLQRMMVVYFLLIGVAAMVVGGEFVWDARAPALRDGLLRNLEACAGGEMIESHVFDPLDRLTNKAILVIGMILAVVMIVFVMFIKQITEPLQHMIEISEKISSGDLTGTIRVHSGNELADLGNVINELSSNLQEILLASRSVCTSGHELAAAADPDRDGRPADSRFASEMQVFRQELGRLNDLVDCFNFYTFEERSSSNQS